ncbi:hypothetical protein ACFE04_004930 [Oxalis oulophora]
MAAASAATATGVVAKGTLMSPQENATRNKRKFRADPPSTTDDNLDKEFEFATIDGHSTTCCDMCGANHDHSDEDLNLDIGLSSVITASSFDVGPNQIINDLENEEFQKADWTEFTEAELEEIALRDLDLSFKTAIKKIVACGYPEEVASKAVLRSGVCYGNKDTISNIVNNTLAFLSNVQDNNKYNNSKEHCFEDLQQLEKYLFAEQVCVLREVRPFFSTGDAMWNLLITDMNLSHAFTVDTDPAQTQSETEDKSSELITPSPSNSVSSVPFPHSSQGGTLPVAGVSNVTKSKKSSVSATSVTMHKTFSITGTSQSPVFEDKFVGTSARKVQGMSRREIFRQRAAYLEKNQRTYTLKSLRAVKGGFLLEKKLKPVTDSTALKHASAGLSKAMGLDIPQKKGSHKLSNNPEASSLPNKPSILPPVGTADTEPSLSLKLPTDCNAESSNSSQSRIPDDKPLSVWVPGDKKDDNKPLNMWVPRDEKDEVILKLVPRMRELQNQLQEWTEWVNKKVMQAARRLGKDKAELKALRQEKEEVEQLKKEKQSLEENTVKKLSDMVNALRKASVQVERANAAVRRLDVENKALRYNMEAAKVRAADSAENFQEVMNREKNTLMEVQSWEKQKILCEEELATEKGRVAKLLQELEQAKVLQEQMEARFQQEKKTKCELLLQASSLRKERENIEASTKSKENTIQSKAEINLQCYKDDIEKLEKEISQLRLKTDSSKIAALRRGIDGSYAGKLTDNKEFSTLSISGMLTDLKNCQITGGVKRERECVMCLSEEMSVVFLPCAHQVVCLACNEQHEKQGMKDCPSCRSPIQRRIPVRYASI